MKTRTSDTTRARKSVVLDRNRLTSDFFTMSKTELSRFCGIEPNEEALAERLPPLDAEAQRETAASEAR